MGTYALTPFLSLVYNYWILLNHISFSNNLQPVHASILTVSGLRHRLAQFLLSEFIYWPKHRNQRNRQYLG